MMNKVKVDLKNALKRSLLEKKEKREEEMDYESPGKMFDKSELELSKKRQVVFN